MSTKVVLSRDMNCSCGGGVLLIPFKQADAIASEVSRSFSVSCLIASYI